MCEVHHSPTSSVKVNEWSYTTTPIRLLGVDMDNFKFFYVLFWCSSNDTLFTIRLYTNKIALKFT